MRVHVFNGNGYECDICHTLLNPYDVYRVKCHRNVDSTGRMALQDTIGVCATCYEKHFPLLNGRGIARKHIRGKKVGVDSWK